MLLQLRSRCCALSQAPLGRSINYSDASTSPTKSMLKLLKKGFDLPRTTPGSCKVGSDGPLLTNICSNAFALGVAFLDKSLFTSYTVNLEDPESLPNFQINLPALLETLQIFGAVDVAARVQRAEQDPYRSNIRNYRPDAFSNQALGISGTCCLIYSGDGAPFSIVIEESGVKTTASLATYLPEIPEDIPFDRNNLTFKIIMQARYLLDTLAELAPTSPKRLRITATRNAPYLALVGHGELGNSCVDFAKGRELMENFSIREPWSQVYKFDLIKWSSEAMRIATKVSFRGDEQGVLSLQFMVEVEGGSVCFLDFRFVPFANHEDDVDGEDGEGEDGDDQN